MSSLLDNKLASEASPFSGETSGAVARAGESDTLSKAEVNLVKSGGRRRRRSSKRSAKKSLKARRGSRKSRRSLRSLRALLPF